MRTTVYDLPAGARANYCPFCLKEGMFKSVEVQVSIANPSPAVDKFMVVCREHVVQAEAWMKS